MLYKLQEAVLFVKHSEAARCFGVQKQLSRDLILAIIGGILLLIFP